MDFCKNCGARLTPDADRCAVCGAPRVYDAPPCSPDPEPAVPQPEPSLPPCPPPVPDPLPPAPPKGTPTPHYCREPEETDATPSIEWYFGMLLLFVIPVIGLVAMLCFSFLPGCSQRQRNLARACLLLTLMIAALISIAVLLVTIALGSWQRAMLYAYYGIS